METNSETSSTRVLIIGAGPIGLELAVACKRRQIPIEIFDAGAIGKTITWWAPQTRWFSSNDRISIAGVPLFTSDQQKATREEYLTYLRSVVRQFEIDVQSHQRVVNIGKHETGFTVTAKSSRGLNEIQCENVVLAVGGLDHARRLGVPGEDLPHVDGYLREPHRYYGRRVLIVGGRNSAVESALRLYHTGARVSLSYRSSELPKDHIKYWLYPEISGLIRSGFIKAYFNTEPIQITPSHVLLKSTGQQSSENPFEVPAEDVLTMIGYEQEKSLFRQAGIDLIGDNQKPQIDEATMESNIPGIYVAGTAVAGTQSSNYRLFLENCHEHVTKIIAHLTGESLSATSPVWQDLASQAPES